MFNLQRHGPEELELRLNGVARLDGYTLYPFIVRGDVGKVS